MKYSNAISKLEHLRDCILAGLPKPKAAANYSFLSNSKANRQLREMIEWLDQRIVDLNKKSRDDQLSKADVTQILNGLNNFELFFLKIGETLRDEVSTIKVDFLVYRNYTQPFRKKLPYKI